LITAWRLVKSKHAKSAFTGAGCQYASGRWHHQYIPVVYTAGSQALAILEYLVHGQAHIRLFKFKMIEVSIPEKLVLDVENIKLPRNWRSLPPPASTKNIGSKWKNDNLSAVLSVPSVLSSDDRNFVINPNHPDFSKVKIHPAMNYAFDGRL